MRLSPWTAAGVCFVAPPIGMGLDDVQDFRVEQLHRLPNEGKLSRLELPLLATGWGGLMQPLGQIGRRVAGNEFEIDSDWRADDFP